jgi:hypothetical protein
VEVDVVGVGGGSLLVHIIEAPHSFHTHIRSTLSIYNKMFQHLQLCLVVIRMLPHPYMCSVGPESGKWEWISLVQE